MGWALYRAFGKRRLADMWKVLEVAEAFNVGTWERNRARGR
jgi:CRISPR/Cas system endoribonuclease Cas6 (RAMP superfamily)